MERQCQGLLCYRQLDIHPPEYRIDAYRNNLINDITPRPRGTVRASHSHTGMKMYVL